MIALSATSLCGIILGPTIVATLHIDANIVFGQLLFNKCFLVGIARLSPVSAATTPDAVVGLRTLVMAALVVVI